MNVSNRAEGRVVKVSLLLTTERGLPLIDSLITPGITLFILTVTADNFGLVEKTIWHSFLD